MAAVVEIASTLAEPARKNFKQKCLAKAQKTSNHVFPHMWTLDQGQIQQGDWTLVT
jgi:hypothetical protein